jgi:UDP-N-acetyl-D-mannosaminuronic acid transferase (WecB/TagA/CpsF family)
MGLHVNIMQDFFTCTGKKIQLNDINDIKDIYENKINIGLSKEKICRVLVKSIGIVLLRKIVSKQRNRSDAKGFDLAETFARPALECSDHVFINIW